MNFYYLTVNHKESSEVFTTLNRELGPRPRELHKYTTFTVTYRLKFTKEELLFLKLAHPEIYERLEKQK